jgi:prophage maintenance system killer protein
VGYRVNSKQATSFRVWATKTLKDYLIKGYVINQKRLKESQQNSLKELQKTLSFIQETIKSRQLNQSETDSLLSVLKDYTQSFLLLNQYDEGRVQVAKGAIKSTKQFTYEFIRPAINELKSRLIKLEEATPLFGAERDGSFGGVLKTIYQTFGGKELYESLEEKAAHLLYFIIKDHVFTDGNKRIGAFLFVFFLDQNRILYRKNGERKISDSTLVALALLVAQSNPNEKEQMVALITQLIK